MRLEHSSDRVEWFLQLMSLDNPCIFPERREKLQFTSDKIANCIMSENYVHTFRHQITLGTIYH